MKLLFLAIFLLTTALAFAAVTGGVVRTRIAGIDCLVDRTAAKDVVVLRGTWLAGDACAPTANPAIATLTAGMLDKGTVKRDKFVIARVLEDLGASIQFSAGDSVNAEFSVSCLREDLPVILGVLAEELRAPAFNEDEFAKYKKQLSAAVRRQTENTGAVADRAFVRAAYPAGHVNRAATFEEWQQGIETATIADIKAFHAAYYGPAKLTVVAVGDIDGAQFQRLMEKEFSDWTGGGGASPPEGSVSGAAKGDVAMDQTVFVAGKTSVSVVLGQATGLRYSDPDALPLRLGTGILGEGFTGRLMKQVREKEGLIRWATLRKWPVSRLINSARCSER